MRELAGSFDPAARRQLGVLPSDEPLSTPAGGYTRLVMPSSGGRIPGVALHGPVPRAEHQRVLRSVSAPGADPMVARRGAKRHVRTRVMSLGAGIVIWAVKDGPRVL